MTVRDLFSGARWWLREFSGESAYDKYLARHRRHHPDHPPMSRQEFWRSREREVTTGCC